MPKYLKTVEDVGPNTSQDVSILMTYSGSRCQPETAQAQKPQASQSRPNFFRPYFVRDSG
jgi:hypothetical protein